MGFLLLLGLAADEVLNIGVLNVEDHHLRSPTGLPTGLDHTGE